MSLGFITPRDVQMLLSVYRQFHELPFVWTVLADSWNGKDHLRARLVVAADDIRTAFARWFVVVCVCVCVFCSVWDC